MWANFDINSSDGFVCDKENIGRPLIAQHNLRNAIGSRILFLLFCVPECRSMTWTLLTSFRCWHLNNFAWTSLEHHEAVFAQCWALHGEGCRCSCISGLEVSVFHFGCHCWMYLNLLLCRSKWARSECDLVVRTDKGDIKRKLRCVGKMKSDVCVSFLR